MSTKRTKPSKAQTLAQLLTEAAHHLREHAAHYDHQSPRDLPAQLIKAAGAIAKAQPVTTEGKP